MSALLSVDERSRGSQIAFVKHFVEKCIRKFGRDKVLAACPLEHQKLVIFLF